MLGKQNVPGIAAVHYALGDVDASAGEIGVTIYIYHSTHRTAVNAHPNLKARMLFQGANDLDRTLDWRFRAGIKHQRHPIASWNFNQALRRFGLLILIRPWDHLGELSDNR